MAAIINSAMRLSVKWEDAQAPRLILVSNRVNCSRFQRTADTSGWRPHRRGQRRAQTARRRLVRLERQCQPGWLRAYANGDRRRFGMRTYVTPRPFRRRISRNITTASPIGCSGRSSIIASIWLNYHSLSIWTAICASNAHFCGLLCLRSSRPKTQSGCTDYHLMPLAKELSRARPRKTPWGFSCISPARPPDILEGLCRIIGRRSEALSPL